MTGWYTNVVSNASVASYTATADDCYLFLDTAGHNSTITLPSAIEAGRGYVIRKIDTSNSTVTILTDNSGCQISYITDSITTNVTSSFAANVVNSSATSTFTTALSLGASYVMSFSAELIMGPDGNYYVTSEN